jgi:hypothetical protein
VTVIGYLFSIHTDAWKGMANGFIAVTCLLIPVLIVFIGFFIHKKVRSKTEPESEERWCHQVRRQHH